MSPGSAEPPDLSGGSSVGVGPADRSFVPQKGLWTDATPAAWSEAEAACVSLGNEGEGGGGPVLNREMGSSGWADLYYTKKGMCPCVSIYMIYTRMCSTPVFGLCFPHRLRVFDALEATAARDSLMPPELSERTGFLRG